MGVCCEETSVVQLSISISGGNQATKRGVSWWSVRGKTGGLADRQPAGGLPAVRDWRAGWHAGQWQGAVSTHRDRDRETCVVCWRGMTHTREDDKNNEEGKRNNNVLGRTMRDFFLSTALPTLVVGVACELPSDRQSTVISSPRPNPLTQSGWHWLGSARRHGFFLLGLLARDSRGKPAERCPANAVAIAIGQWHGTVVAGVTSAGWD